MNFLGGYDFGMFGSLLAALIVGTVVIVLIFLLQAARQARRQIKDHEHDVHEQELD